MDKPEEEEKQNQGVIKTVASPTVLAAILDESIGDKQTLIRDLECSPQQRECLDSNETEKRPSLNMDGDEKESNLVDSIVDDSLEIDSPGSLDQERLKSDKIETTEGANISDNSSLIEGSTLRENTQDKSMDSKPTNKDVKHKQIPKQKPRQANFIDLNKGKLNRKPGKNSYAAIYSQKIKTKQENTKAKNEQDSDFKEKEKRGQRKKEQTWNSDVSSSRQYCFATIPEINSSLSNQPQHNLSNYEKSPYYNVNESYIPSTNTYNYALPGTQSALTQPYHAPYRDFGLRYSNYGHQSYMAPSAAAYHRHPGANMHLLHQQQGYSSQSAPPGIPGRQSLLDQVEFFPEQEYFLSQSLTNSQFINPLQIYQRDSVLERRFVSEPQLPSVTEVNKHKDTTTGNTNNSSQKPADYKPYTLKDYRQIKNEQLDTLGSLGPNTESDDYKEKITKLNKQKEYAEMLRIDHAARKKQWAKKSAVAGPPARHIQAEAKRQAAINYAKTVPKPKLTETKQHRDPNQVQTVDNEKDVPLIEVLRMRHVQEKNQVEAIRKELIAKTQQ